MSDKARVWLNGRWKVVTATSVSKEYSQSVPVYLERFWCPSCQQPLGFVYSTKKSPYFMHSSAVQDKSCDLRAKSYEGMSFHAGERQFPLKIQLNGDKTQFFVGLFRVNEKLIEKKFRFNVNLTTVQKTKEQRNFISDRLLDSSITYLSIGRYPPLYIEVQTTEDTGWPKSRIGVKPSGSLFDAHSGKLLPEEADVVVGKEYFLLIREGYIDNNHYRYSVTCKKKQIDLDGWELFVCKAEQSDIRSACFFMTYSANLTDSPIRITPIWPVVTRSSYEINVPSKIVYMAVSGDIRSKIAPAGCYLRLDDNRSPEFQTFMVYEIQSIYKPIISLGRRGLIKFTQIRYSQEENHSFSGQPVIELKDSEDNVIADEVLHKKLSKDIVKCLTHINLTYVIQKDLVIVEMGEIRAKTEKIINLFKGQTLRIFCGKDCLKQLSIKHLKIETSLANTTDENLEMYDQIEPLTLSPAVVLAYNKKFRNKSSSLLKGYSIKQIYKLIK